MSSDRTQLKVGQGFRDNDPRENGKRVVFIVALNGIEAKVRNESYPHRRSHILRSRLESGAYSFVGEMGPEPESWPAWFREDTEAHNA